MKTTASVLAEFIAEIRFEDVPGGILYEAKRILLDSIGCILEGLLTEKGRIVFSYGKRDTARPEATLIGSPNKVSAPVAAFVNAELLNALDYEALCAPSGHVTPYVFSAPLAVAEWKNASGKNLLLATALAHEIAQRIYAGLVIPERLSVKAVKDGIPLRLPIHGYGANIFGGIAGVAKILNLNAEQIEHALGIGGAMCPIPTLMQFAEKPPATMSKFSPSGWISQAEVTATLLAEMGYTGDRNVFDGEFAFWKSFAADDWDPRIVLNGLGKIWFLSNAVGYKPYPCCGAMHGALDILCAIIDRFDIQPQDIKEINIGLNLLAELSLWKNRIIENHIDAQFSTAYVFAVAAHRIKPGHMWQAQETYSDPKILEFMKRIHIFTPASSPHEKKGSVVEVIVLDKKNHNKIRYTEADVWPIQNEIDDPKLYEKFKNNASHVLPLKTIDQVYNVIFSLDEMDDIICLMELLSPS